ncbi:MAG: AMP-dependent synthetase [Clostridiales bacterium GWF2_36_10]|nr:MAG: AMP-dependent synthetase [Clostridiales bacterium GWF2_36_10]HAN22062.1 AMP-dependent synthetase [Clostridiales bacterium]
MKIAFSTLACPDYSFSDIYSMATDLGFDGVEVRGLGLDIFDGRTMPFSEQQLPQTVQKLRSLGLEVSCLSSGCCLKFASKAKENIEEIKKYIELANALKTKFVRVLGDLNPSPSCDPTEIVDDDTIFSQLNELVPFAEQNGITLLVETNGVYSDTSRLKALLDRFKSDSIAALWDFHHPYRYSGESPEKTVQNLGRYIQYVHVKDSIIADGTIRYRLMGEGDLPIPEMIFALRSINYSGFITLEWVKRWAPDLEDAGIVFPQYVNYMSQYTGKGKSAGALINNLRGDGKYIWEKNTLIDLTFPQVLDRVCEAFPNQYAFRYTTHNYTRTYPQFKDDVDKFARALISLGVKRGDHVSVWATNVPQWFITFWAVTKIGAVLVTVNTAYKIYEAEYLLRQSDTHTLVMIDGYKDSDYVGIIKELCPELENSEPGKPLYIKRLPFLRNIITIDSKQNGCLTWEEAVAYAENTPIEEVQRRAAAISKFDVCNMQYTSGTTGFPKGVMLTHYNVVNNGKTIGDGMDLSTADRMMIQVPMFHCFGMVLAMTASITHGTTMSPIAYFQPKISLECINKEKITAFHGVPTMFIALLEHEDFKKTDFSHLRTGIMAGSPCPVKVMQDVFEKMNMSEITIVYGQTEASPGCTMSMTTDSIDVRVNTVGRAMYGVECKIVDPETGKDLPDNVDGEFVARGYNIMKGYYKMPQATANAIDADGWLHTGDLARRDANGNYKITGRIKDMIIRGGENIYPKEIEDFIYTHPKVKDVQVIGVPDKQYGEEIMACVIVKDGQELTADELKDYIRSHMAKHKTPRYIDFVTEFPMNAAGKILKYKMRENAVEKLGLQAESKIVTA